jgi:hypothetical protein
MSDLIIGVIKNYSFNDLKPFVNSLSKSKYTGDTVLFCNNISDNTKVNLTKNGITCIDFNDEYPYLERYTENMGILPRTYNKKLHLFSMRYIPYYLFLKNSKKKYGNIMITDVRDVIFQKDPFNFKISGNLCCTLEAEGWSLEDSDFNGNEIKIAFGQKEFEKIKKNLISNCGVTIGPFTKIIEYLEKMISLILAGDGSVIMDQGTHNYIVWNKMIDNIVCYKNNAGPVLTLGYEKKVFKNKDGMIIDNNGNVINIIHQYDRHYMVAKDYYDWPTKIKYAKHILKNRYLKKLNDNSSDKILHLSPKLHSYLKKIKLAVFRNK